MKQRICIKICQECGIEFKTSGPRTLKCENCRKCLRCGKPVYESATRFCGHSCAAAWNYKNGVGEKLIEGSRRIAYSESGRERAAKISQALKGIVRPRGKANSLWKGNKSQRQQDMARIEYLIWRATVFKRDNYTCAMCGSCGEKLEAHHIQSWADVEHLRYDVTNGIALCKQCHRSIRGKESDFVDRFNLYVRHTVKVKLVQDEIDRLTPFIPLCSECGNPVRKKQCFRNRRWHFCNKECKQKYEKRIGGNWNQHRFKV